MSNLEIDAVLESYIDEYKNEWEKTRWLGYLFNVSMTGSKNDDGTDKTPKTLITLPWEEEEVKAIKKQQKEQSLKYLLELLEKIN